MELLDQNMQDLGLHGGKDLVDEAEIVEETEKRQIATRIVRIDNQYYKYKYYQKSDVGLPVTANYTILHKVQRDESKSLGWKVIED